MNIKLNHQIIKEVCGITSFKRGSAFYHANKVVFDSYQNHQYNATVTGTEDFHVTIKHAGKGEFKAECTCPKLASFDKDCQHIAAVLLSIYEQQRKGTMLENSASSTEQLTEGLFGLFNSSQFRASRHQDHFENREVLETEFVCRPIKGEDGHYLLGIEISIQNHKIRNIRTFLEKLKQGDAIQLSSFTFYHDKHCFLKEDDVILQQLIQVAHDEKIYNEHRLTQSQLILIPPTSFGKLFPFLLQAPLVKIENKKKRYLRIIQSKDLLPINFSLGNTHHNSYELLINGLEKMVVLQPYQCILYENTVTFLENEDSIRLFEMQQMLKSSGTNRLMIPQNQITTFLEKVVPGLRRLGNVSFTTEMTNLMIKTPLVAKLYVDRIKNRLLASLEFQYDHIILNPLESREPPTNTLLIRDLEKENEILRLMEEAMFSQTDEGYYLQNEELEYEFLHYLVPKLQKLTQIYTTTAVRSRLFKENVKPQIRIKMKKERINWLEFKFEIEGFVDKQIKEILEALEEKRKYYRLKNGSLLSLESKEFQEIQRFLQSPFLQNQRLSDGLDIPFEKCIQLLDYVDSSESFQLEASFREFLQTVREPGSLEFPIPERLDSILKDYQKTGYKWMKTLAHYGFGGILADDMGLGKTVQSIAFIVSELSSIRETKNPVLILCPSSLTYNWLSELLTFAPEVQAIVLDGSRAERESLQKDISNIDVVITSYPLLRKDIKWYEKHDFHSVFYDEAQAFKNPLTQTARAVKKIKANYRFALTGTPVENSAEELWAIFHVVFPQLFLGLKEYSQLTNKTISRRIRPFLLRRIKEEVLHEFPKKYEETDTVELLQEQKKLYAAYLAKLRHDTLKHLDKDTIRKNRIRILAGITRLRQICCHPKLFVDGYKGSSAKFEQLFQIIEEAKHAGKRVLIFSQFTKMLELIGKELTIRGLSYFYLDGQTPSEERVEICQRYNTGERDYFLISLKAGGTGLNLMGADTVILYDTWWNPAVEEQAADRAHRIGQKNSVTVLKLISKGTIEEKMNELQDKKRNLVEEIIESNSETSSTLTEEDIREILML
ncbi:DEAD/DEAH box helicase [Metabacillus niabensis]|uniref:DEAD/DEAH box helicase n=1 Tax=Metabacillus niabensis TaxID=324854 RepID=UPI001CF9907B|nr:DEAD/DEAH box helicase [Metabacillus niabensis]